MSLKNHSLSSHQVAAASHLPDGLTTMCAGCLSVCTKTMHIKARYCVSVRRPAAWTSMKIFPDPPPVNHNPALPPTNHTCPWRHSGEEWRRSCSRLSAQLRTGVARLLRTRMSKMDWCVDGPKPWGTRMLTENAFPSSPQRSLLSLPLTAWCSPFAVYLEEDECCSCKGREGGGSSTVHEGFPFSFFFSKISNLYQKEINAHRLSSAADDDILWKPWISRRDQPRRASRRLESVRYWVCRWTFTESVYKVDKTSLTKLNFALHLCVFKSVQPLLTFRFLRDAEGKRRDVFCSDVLKTIYRERSGR